MGKMRKLLFKKNDSGATLVAVLIVIAFIAVLGSISISAAMVNFKMKVVDKKTQKTFYSCEEAVDEIYSQLGMKSMNALETAYQDLMATMIRSQQSPASTPDNPSWYNFSVNNEMSPVPGLTKADLELRQRYMRNIINELTEGSFDPNSPLPLDENKFRQFLNEYISVDIKNSDINNKIKAGTFHKPYVESIEKCYYTLNYTDNSVYIFNADNVKVRYITEDGFTSQLTFDIGIKLPISNINFTSAQQTINAVPSLGNFSLVANNGITVAPNKQVTIDGNVYGGGPNGILVRDSSRTSFIGEQVIVPNDVTSQKQTQLTFSNSTQLWCNNIIIPKEYSEAGMHQCHGVTLNLNGSTFVKNDLKINGASSNVYIGGVYNGYSNQGVTDLNRDQSSAIIVNGAHSNLTLKTSYIYLAGRSYIVYDGTAEPYRTGESLSFKGDQEAYLVPPAIVNEVSGKIVGNPYVGAAPIKQNDINEYLNTKYFAKSLLDTSKPCVSKKIGNETYIYLNFKDAKASSDYMYWILSSETDFRAKMAGLGMSGEDIDTAYKQKTYMKNLIQFNLKDLGQQSSGFIAPDGAVTSSGTIVEAEVNGTTAKTGASVSMAADTKQLVTADLTNRYRTLTTVLDMPEYSLESTSFATMDNSFVGQSGSLVEYNKVLGYGATVGERLVSRSDIVKAANIAIGGDISTLGGNVRKYGTGDYPIVIANGGYTFNSSSGFKGGIIVSIGNVNVEADFDGLIITISSGAGADNGKININGDVNITNTLNIASLIDSVCTQVSDTSRTEDPADVLMNVFRGTRIGGDTDSSGEEKIEINSIRYDQLVYFDNWKKTEVSEPPTEEESTGFGS